MKKRASKSSTDRAEDAIREMGFKRRVAWDVEKGQFEVYVLDGERVQIEDRHDMATPESCHVFLSGLWRQTKADRGGLDTIVLGPGGRDHVLNITLNSKPRTRNIGTSMPFTQENLLALFNLMSADGHNLIESQTFPFPVYRIE
jgi:hypothetical protein